MSEWITSPKDDKDLLMFCASFIRAPSDPLFDTLSRPARSTRLSFPEKPTNRKRLLFVYKQNRTTTAVVLYLYTTNITLWRFTILLLGEKASLDVHQGGADQNNEKQANDKKKQTNKKGTRAHRHFRATLGIQKLGLPMVLCPVVLFWPLTVTHRRAWERDECSFMSVMAVALLVFPMANICQSIN